MNETLKKYSQQITNLWEKYDKKTKLYMLGVAVLVIAVLAVLVFLLNKPKMVTLTSNITPTEAADIRDVLKENKINYKVSDDSTSIMVEAQQLADAKMALGKKGIPTKGFTYKDAFDSSFSTTDAEKQLKYNLAFQNELVEHIKSIDGISDAKVNLVIPTSDRTIFDENKEAKASVIIKTKKEISNEQVQGIVNFIAGSVQNLEPKNVKIIDQTGKILYLGVEDDYTMVNKQYEYKHLLESQVETKIFYQLVNSGLFDSADVKANLIINFDKQSSVSEEYTTPSGQSKGVPGSEYHYESSGTNGSATGAPGTDTNGANTEYLMPEDGSSENNTTIDKTDYNVNKTVTNREKNSGDINYDDSTISIVVNKFKTYNQGLLEKQGLLKDTTFDQFKEQNNEAIKLEIQEDVVDIIKNATGIKNIEIIGFERPIFNAKVVSKKPWTEYIPIALTLLIIALLAYVVYKGFEPIEVVETEPELSVEDLLATTKEQQTLEEIEFDERSETRKHIEKFVEDNPEAVAQLLRNWLNEDLEV